MKTLDATSLAGALFALAVTGAVPAMGAEKASPVRIGVAGLTHGHSDWILDSAERGDIELVGIAEANADLARRATAEHGLSMDLVYSDLESMLDAVRPEAVTAFGSIREHLAVVEACAPRGIHVMVEKPLAMNFQHAKRMAALAREHGIQSADELRDDVVRHPPAPL